MIFYKNLTGKAVKRQRRKAKGSNPFGMTASCNRDCSSNQSGLDLSKLFDWDFLYSSLIEKEAVEVTQTLQALAG